MSHSSDSALSFPRLLDALEFPVTRDELRRRADRLQAPLSIREAIERLGPGEFVTRRDLTRAIEALVKSTDA